MYIEELQDRTSTYSIRIICILWLQGQGGQNKNFQNFQGGGGAKSILGPPLCSPVYVRNFVDPMDGCSKLSSNLRYLVF